MADKTLDNLDLGADFYDDDERVTQKGPGSKKKKRAGRSPKKRAAAREAEQ